MSKSIEDRLVAVAKATVAKYPGNMKQQADAMEEVVRPCAELVYALARDCIRDRIIEFIKIQTDANRVSEAARILRAHQDEVGIQSVRQSALPKPTSEIKTEVAVTKSTPAPAVKLTPREAIEIRGNSRAARSERSLLMTIRPNNKPMGDQTAQELNDWCDSQELQLTEKSTQVRFVRLATAAIYASHATGPVGKYLTKEAELKNFWELAVKQEGNRYAA